MHESTKKTNPKKRESWNLIVLNKLEEKHGFTKYYIRQCLRGDRNNITADTIRKEYASLCIEVNKALENIK